MKPGVLKLLTDTIYSAVRKDFQLGLFTFVKHNLESKKDDTCNSSCLWTVIIQTSSWPGSNTLQAIQDFDSRIMMNTSDHYLNFPVTLIRKRQFPGYYSKY